MGILGMCECVKAQLLGVMRLHKKRERVHPRRRVHLELTNRQQFIWDKKLLTPPKGVLVTLTCEGLDA